MKVNFDEERDQRSQFGGIGRQTRYGEKGSAGECLFVTQAV